jgi:cell fate (sporulation/competence/biofilm development) regulator YlbF (YheA/YmcA/DUF963 family)
VNHLNIHLISAGACVLLCRPQAWQNVRHRENKLIMPTLTEDNVVIQKTKELCQTILDQPDLQSARQRIDAFMADESSRAQYDGLVTKGQALQQKQQMATPLTSEEIADFEKHRETLLNNPVARGFLDAQEELHQVRDSVQKYVAKTLEIGRVPEPDDFSSCGHGCSCGH